MPPDITQLELVGDGYITCLSTWLYPGDDEIRQAAYDTVAALGLDYIEVLAAVMEQHNLTADDARFRMAHTFKMQFDELIAQGHRPRPNAILPDYRSEDPDAV